MTVRKQNLEEWFSQYQLTALQRNHFFIPIDMEIDVTTLAQAYAALGERAPFTAIVVKAAAVLAREHPAINRAVLSTPLGTRVVQFDEAHVNLPVRVEHAGEAHLSATVIRNADNLQVAEIIAAIRTAQARRLEDLPIGRHFIANRNTLLNRSKLKLLHAAAYSVPALYARHGGGISVSSLVRPAPQGVTRRTPSYGPTAALLCPGYVRNESNGRVTLFMGIGLDHYAVNGVEATRVFDHLGELLAQGDCKLFGPSPRACSLSLPPHVPSSARDKGN